MVSGAGFWLLVKKGKISYGWIPVTASFFLIMGVVLLAINANRFKLSGMLFEIAGALLFTSYALLPKKLRKKNN